MNKSKPHNVKKITKILIDILKKNNKSLKKERIPTSKSLHLLGYIDSFDIMNLIEIVQKNFAIKFKNDELDINKISNLEKFSKIIIKKLNSRN